MKRTIQLKESDIRRMVMEALTEYDLDAAKRFADYAEKKSMDPNASPEEREKYRKHYRNFTDPSSDGQGRVKGYVWDKEDNPNRPVVTAPDDFEWSQQSQDMQDKKQIAQRKADKQKFIDDINARAAEKFAPKEQPKTETNTGPKLNKEVSDLLRNPQLHTIKNMLNAWIESVKNQGNEVDGGEIDDLFSELYDETDLDNNEVDDEDGDNENEFSDENEQPSIENDINDGYRNAEYWALQSLCTESVLNYKRGFFGTQDIESMAAMTWYNLTTIDDYIPESKFDEMVPDSDKDSYMFDKGRGYIKVIDTKTYSNLPDNDKFRWKRYGSGSKSGKAGLYRQIRNRLDRMGNKVQARVTPEQVERELSEIVSYAFTSGKVCKFAYAIINSNNPYETLKYCIKQAGADYLTKYKRDEFLSGVDSSVSGDADASGEGGFSVPLELQTNPINSGDTNTAKAGEMALNEIKDTLEFLLMDEYNGDINKFQTEKGRYNESMKTAVKFILDNFSTIFDTKSMDTFNDLISKTSGTGDNEHTSFRDNAQKGMMFVKRRVAECITQSYIQMVNENSENVTTKIPKVDVVDPVTGQTVKKNGKPIPCATSGNKAMDKLCKVVADSFSVEDGKAIYSGDIQANTNQMLNKLEPLWAIIGQGTTKNGEDNKWSRGNVLRQRFKDYKAGRLKPLSNNAEVVSESYIRRIVMETIKRQLRLL